MTPAVEFAAYIGLDWEQEQHAICVELSRGPLSTR
jgi:hypothetical protein